MTQAQRDELLIEFNRYEVPQQKAMINEYLGIKNGEYCKSNSLFDYLQGRLDIEGYWKKVGLAN